MMAGEVACNRTMEQARRDFASGKLSGVLLVRVPMTAGDWTVRLAGARGDVGMLLEVKTLAPQVFGSLDQAVQAIEQIGFSFTQLKVQ